MESQLPAPREVVILGSTGSIGTQAADIVRRNPGRFRITALAAGGSNPALLASQALEFSAKVIAVAATNDAPLRDFSGYHRIARPGVPLVLIPTTAGTGSEVTKVAVITDTERNDLSYPLWLMAMFSILLAATPRHDDALIQ